jgi:lysophospholipase L1-like esterase
MKRYLAETLKGMPPHIVLLNVGDNDTFGLVPEEKDSAVEKEFIVHMNTFLDHLREIAPKATFGVMLPNTYNYTERSFLHNYGPNFTRWRQLQNRQRYIEIMADISKKRGDLVIIPSNLVVDGIDGMPYNSGTHFNNLGARQFAGAAFAWLKVQFTKPIDRTVKSDASQVTTGSIKTAAPGTPAPAPPPASEGSSWFSRSFKSVTGK